MTQNEKSKIRAKVIKWVTRLFLILVAIIMLYPPGVERRFFVQNQYRVSDGSLCMAAGTCMG